MASGPKHAHQLGAYIVGTVARNAVRPAEFDPALIHFTVEPVGRPHDQTADTNRSTRQDPRTPTDDRPTQRAGYSLVLGSAARDRPTLQIGTSVL
jgi:hypothetical protein